MSVFFKDVKERLVAHINEMGAYVPFPANWRWHPEAVRRLDRLEKRIRSDIISLKKKCPEESRYSDTVLEVMKKLETDLVSMMDAKDLSLQDQDIIKTEVDKLLREIQKETGSGVAPNTKGRKGEDNDSDGRVNFAHFIPVTGRFRFQDFARGPCIILLTLIKGRSGLTLGYCHYDEFHRSDLLFFIQEARKRGATSIIFLGGFGSKNAPVLLKEIKRSGLRRFIEADFGIGEINTFTISEEGISFCTRDGNQHALTNEQVYSFLSKS